MLKITEKLSPNHGPKRPAGVTAVVIHTTEGSMESAVEWFLNPASDVSAHYVIGKDGKICRCVPDELIAWHAGASELHGVSNVNDFSIGIELEGQAGNTEFEEAQFGALLELVTDLCITYKIPLNRIVGHEHVAVPHGRKNDPGNKFPWNEFLICLGTKVADAEMREEDSHF